MRPDWTTCGSWLVPVDRQAKKRETKWVCVCDECQQERIIGYCCAWDLIKGKHPRTCTACAFRLGRRIAPRPALISEESQRRSAESRRGIKRPKTTRRLEFEHIFAPDKMLTTEIKAKQRAAKLGKRGPATNGWRGGTTDERRIALSRYDYKQLRLLVFRRDSWTCQVCKVRGGKLELHHVVAWSHSPELRYEPTNCQTLCHSCHTQTDNYLTKAIQKGDSSGL